MFALKAYNGRCVMEWLAVRVYEAYLNPQYAAFDPARFCVIAGAMCLGGSFIARSLGLICSQLVGVRAKKNWDFVVGPSMWGSDSCSINLFCIIGHICKPLQTISRGWCAAHSTVFDFHTLHLLLAQSFSRKKQLAPWASQPLCWGSMLRDSLVWWKGMVGTWSLEAPNIARTTWVDQVALTPAFQDFWKICKIWSKERDRSLIDLWCWQTVFATVPEEYQVGTEAHQLSSNHIAQELSH